MMTTRVYLKATAGHTSQRGVVYHFWASLAQLRVEVRTAEEGSNGGQYCLQCRPYLLARTDVRHLVGRVVPLVVAVLNAAVSERRGRRNYPP